MRKRLLWIFLTPLVLLPLVVIAFNLGDEDLSQESQALLNSKVASPPKEAVEGFKYLLGFKVGRESDPLVEGSKIHSRIQSSLLSSESVEFPNDDEDLFTFQDTTFCVGMGLCEESEFNEHKGEIKTILERHKLALERYSRLVEFGSEGSDLVEDDRVPYPITTLILADRLKRLQFNYLFYEGQLGQVVKELVPIFKFTSESIRYPGPLVRLFVDLVILHQQRQFLNEAIVKEPRMQDLLKLDDHKALRLNVDFEELLDVSLFYEARAVMNLLTRPLGFLFREFDLIQMDSRTPSFWDQLWIALLNRSGGLIYQPNRTLNRYHALMAEIRSHPCIVKEEPCTTQKEPFHELGSFFRNPIGERLLIKLLIKPRSLQKAYRHHQSLVQSIF